MAQTSPSAQLSKHPAPNIPSANGPSNVTQFTPRKEFIRDQRVISSFALLALSGANLVRLYSFPGLVISALRRLFDQQDLIVSVREHTHKHFFEFALDRRPWASPKSVESEKLIIAILGAVFQCGYSFLSTIDYGREPDDRVAIAFSKPVALSAPVTVGQVASSSTVVLPQPSRAPFAISFVSPSVLRVVDPPLASTPAIIQAVRGSWPLGVVSEKKLGDATYQFKLKGYKFFQEDNFAADSLHQILTLLSTLDSHAFTLLTSLTLTNRSRKQDLWIFTGPAEGPHSGESAQSSPAGSSMELKAENSPYGAQTSSEKLAPVASTSRLSTLPAVSSPLNPTVAKALGNTLRKASPKVNIPLAFMDDVDSATNSPVDNKQHPFSSSMGSVDMTGIGSGRGKGGERLSRSPELLYMTTGVPGNGYIQGHRDELNPWNIVPSSQLPPTLPYPAFVQDPNTPRSPPPQDAVPPLSHSRNASIDNPSASAAVPPTTPPPYPAGSNSPPYLTPQVQSPEPTQASRQDYFGGNESSPDRSQDSVRRDKDGSPRDAPDTPRTPTPPLLPSAVFRDSALSITTGRTSYEIPIQWTGRDPEPGRTTLAWIKEEDEGAKQRQPTPELRERPREQPRPRMERTSTGPMSIGAWAPAPKDERRAHDVVISMLPPTIREQPSQEHDERGQFTSRGKSKLATTETDTRETSKSPDSTMSGGQSGTTTTSRRRRSPTRRDTDGWVLVNIDRGHRKDKTSSTGRQTHSVSPTRRTKSPTLGPSTQRPTPHKRSSSDSRVQRSPQPQEGAPVASMSAAAKAIVIIDAVGAKEKEQEKSSNSGFRKMFSKSREKGSKG